jgi:hypothetical protein
MRRRTFLAGPGSTMILAPCMRAAWAADTPKDIVEKLYSQAAAKKGGWDSPLLKSSVRGHVFSKPLSRAWNAADARNRKGDVGWLDFDIMSNSQDPSVNGLRINVTAGGAANSTIAAAFRFDTDPKSDVTQVFYDFVLEDGAWKIDDIRGGTGGDQWSAREMAQNAIAPKR